jgi:divalent metal cation (Fe/Co/Zn/Cd) transporter
MTRDPRITPEQEAEESSVRFGLVADCGLLVVLVLSGFLGGSLTILAEAIRGSLMSLTELFSLVVMRRIHRGQLADLEFGTGKLEQVANTAIGAAMLGGAVWIVARALAVLIGERAVGAPFGLAMAAIAGALNAYVNSSPGSACGGRSGKTARWSWSASNDLVPSSWPPRYSC